MQDPNTTNPDHPSHFSGMSEEEYDNMMDDSSDEENSMDDSE